MTLGAEIAAALSRGLRFVLAAQDAQGAWTDWALPPGSSPDWTTAHVGLRLSEPWPAPPRGARRTARPRRPLAPLPPGCRQRLGLQPDRGAGRGFHRAGPPVPRRRRSVGPAGCLRLPRPPPAAGRRLRHLLTRFTHRLLGHFPSRDHAGGAPRAARPSRWVAAGQPRPRTRLATPRPSVGRAVEFLLVVHAPSSNRGEPRLPRRPGDTRAPAPRACAMDPRRQPGGRAAPLHHGASRVPSAARTARANGCWRIRSTTVLGKARPRSASPPATANVPGKRRCQARSLRTRSASTAPPPRLPGSRRRIRHWWAEFERASVEC